MGEIPLPKNLDDVEAGFEHVEPGVWPSEVKEHMMRKGKDSGEPVLLFIGVLLDGPSAGKKIPVNFSLQEQALWKLRQFRDVCGVPSTGRNTIDPDVFVGRRFMAAISDKAFVKDGSTVLRSNVDDFMPYQAA